MEELHGAERESDVRAEGAMGKHGLEGSKEDIERQLKTSLEMFLRFLSGNLVRS